MSSVHSDISPPVGASGSNFSADDVFAAPVSFAQQRMWFLHQLEPESAAYNIQAAVRIQGELNVEALERSLNEVVRRHESLRTSFVTVNERVLQVIYPDIKLKVDNDHVSGSIQLDGETFKKGIEHPNPLIAANVMIGLIKLTNYLLDQQLRRLQQDFLKEGGLRERMTRARLSQRARQTFKPPKP